MTKRKTLCGMVDCPHEAGPWRDFIELCGMHLSHAWMAQTEWEEAEERQARRLGREERFGNVYVVQVGERIKVGFSTDVKRRLRQYPPGSKVLAIVWGEGVNLAYERALHERLTQYRVAGREWYRDCDGVRAVVSELVEKYGKPAIQIEWGSGQRRQRTGVGATRRAAVITDRF